MQRSTQSVLVVFTMMALYFTLIVALIAGWVVNVVNVIHSDFGSITGLLVARVLGILVPPLGTLMGWFF